MSAKKAARKSTGSTTAESGQKTARSAAAIDDKSRGFTEDERAAMKERARELKAEAGRGTRAKADGESDVLAKIAEMRGSDLAMAKRLHAIIMASAPALSQPQHARLCRDQ
jgi:hypothetical protein